MGDTVRSSSDEIGMCPDCGSWLTDDDTFVSLEPESNEILKRVDRCCVCGSSSETLFLGEEE